MSLLDWLKSLFKPPTPGPITEPIIISFPPTIPNISIPPLRLVHPAPVIKMLITLDQLCLIMPTLKLANANKYINFLNDAMVEFDINNNLRISAFIAQLAHESGELKFWKELWGPTEQQKKYEPPSDLATRLGNTQSGDGFKYRGHGPIQITGRFNHDKYGLLIGVNLVEFPDLAATHEIGFRVSSCFWKTNGLNELADDRDFKAITKKINGGYNGLAERERYYKKAKEVLGVGP